MEPQPDGTSSPVPQRTPATLTSTAYFYYDARILAQAAEVLGKRDEARRYSELAEQIKAAFNGEFLDRERNQYGTGSQTGNALALYFGLVPETRAGAVAKNLVDDILRLRQGRLWTGIVGTNALVQALPDIGASDVLFGIVTQTTFPSWGYQIMRGATTLWETWEDNPDRQLSLNMKMFGSCQKFFYKDLAGISPLTPGYRTIRIRPRVVGDLTWVMASVRTIRGLVAIHWKKLAGGLDVELVLPANATAQVSIPTLGLNVVTITENGRPVWRDGRFIAGVAGITSGRRDGEFVTFDAAGGRFRFRCASQ